jgi:hypothetical protein
MLPEKRENGTYSSHSPEEVAMQSKISRRAMVKGGLIAGAFIPAMGLIGNTSTAAALPPLDPKDPTAQALGFVTDSEVAEHDEWKVFLAALADRGASFFDALLPSGSAVADRSQYVGALWELVWAALVTGDTFAPVWHARRKDTDSQTGVRGGATTPQRC